MKTRLRVGSSVQRDGEHQSGLDPDGRGQAAQNLNQLAETLSGIVGQYKLE